MTLICEEYFGGCPKCGHLTLVNHGPEHWGVCDIHQLRWNIGSNLFSNWRAQTPEQKSEAHNRLTAMTEVEPLSEGEPIPGAEDAALVVESLFERIGGAA
ncbi:hypothetical protein MRS76_24390 [Rhizobiaceae bacterium n13]|uniref:hypothetical protein n=1 Tax=Ferirhizobium litorale TaxID=2927786 RepID=UPI0024B2A146|nr:hypothetical protein [Fererhizobium litorale]MDI7865060.1 hypothetical protein [Fererhizobium litorale]